MQDSQRPQVGDKNSKAAAAGLVLYSFGFKHGVPIDMNMMWDLRFLPNPYWQEELRPLSGLDEPVADYVIKSELGRRFLALLEPLLLFVVESRGQLEKRPMRLAFGCTGGRHRSVAIVEAVSRFLTERGLEVHVFHRDMQRYRTE